MSGHTPRVPPTPKIENYALGVITISGGCFERSCSHKKTPPCQSNLNFVTLRTPRPTQLRVSAYRTPSEASPRRRCSHVSRDLWTRPPASLAFTRHCYSQYCMVYGMKTGGRRGVEYCAIVLQYYCNRVGNAGGGGGNSRMIDSCT